MDSALATHIDELQNNLDISEKELKEFIQKFEVLSSTGVNANSLFYILNLNTLKYEYINDVCFSFTGQKQEDFYNKGLNILPEIIDVNDFHVLSTVLFPKMNALVLGLDAIDKKNVVFEFHYSMLNRETEKLTSIVEYSSYSKIGPDGNPLLSTGMCFESVLNFNGVRGIVRMKTEKGQETLFDETITHIMELLTTKETEITKLLVEGLSRKEIAYKQAISYLTVNTHIKTIYKKLNIHKISELVHLFKSNH